MKTRNANRLKLAKERLELKIEKQKFVLYRDYVAFKDAYSPVKFATKIAMNSLKENEDFDPELLEQEQKTKKRKRIRQAEGARDLVLHLFLLAESFFKPSDDELEEEDIYIPPSKNNYIIGKDDQ